MAPVLEEARQEKKAHQKKTPRPIRRVLLALEHEGAKSAVESIEEALAALSEENPK
jgi:hypothetical protein